jgi:hypothetical protein
MTVRKSKQPSQPKQFYQGDVAIIPLGPKAELPKDAKALKREGGRVVLAHGELTGHAHAIADEGAVLFASGNVRILAVGDGGATVRHEEHDAIDLAQGLYEVRRQEEWTDNDEPRQVAD